MKTTILNIGKLLLLSVGVTMVSCEDWLDVRPKSEILTDTLSIISRKPDFR